MSTIKANQWLNSDGTENYKCRAWVNFNGTGTIAIRAAGNVSSITDVQAGDYRINFTTPMADTNYAVMVTGDWAGAVQPMVLFTRSDSGWTLAGSVGVSCRTPGAALLDSAAVQVSIFR